jgi:LysR family glycine cleavage system transcriptional activator
VRCFDIGFREGAYYLVHAESVMRRKAVRVFRDWLIAQGQEADVQGPVDNQPNG